MSLPFTKRGTMGLLAAQAAAALLLATLPACSGGGGDDELRDGADISPHDLVPEGSNAVELRIIGIHVLYVGWEIGTDPSVDPGIPGATPDETETPLTMVFEANGATPDTGTVTVALPNASVAYGDAGPPMLNGTWWQAPHTDKQPNTIMYINFRAEGDVLQTHCIATGENICIHLRTYTFAARGTEFIGATMSGKLILEGPFQELNTRDGVHMITPTYDLFSQPCVYTVPDWAPEEN